MAYLRPLFRSAPRWPWPALLGLVLAGVLPLSGAAAEGIFVPETASRPALPEIAPQFFRLSPDHPDTTFNLLVIPVRFPEDGVLGGGERAGILEQLEGDDPSTLEGYYLAATGGRLRVRSTLAPTVTAAHPRTYYTNEGPGNLGYGIDPRAYPHNAQRLVEEVTATIVDAVDFARYDNTRDGIVDGLLLVHSGPEAPEAGSVPLTPDMLIAHAFTVTEPMLRGGARVFPYAVAATRDAVGPWAHEVGHLLGLTDLYVANSICPDPGVGELSLMATGANRAGGTDPAGFDAWSRQWLGFSATLAGVSPLILDEGEFVRVFRPGFENGPRYFLVERRTGENGLGLDSPAMVVYLVDEEAGDNRSCRFPSESYRPLVEVIAEVCLSSSCATRLDDFSVPSLRDRDGNPTGLVLEFSGDTLRVSHETPVGARISRVGLSVPRDVGGAGRGQPVVLTLRSDTHDAPVEVTLDLAALDPGPYCTVLPGVEWRRTLSPGETLMDSTWAVVGCTPGVFPPGEARFELTLRRAGSAAVKRDTLTFPLDRVGWTGGLADTFEVTNLNPDRANPWNWTTNGWEAGPLDPLAYGELTSPWLSVPEDATLTIDHAWDLETLSPDVSLDGVQVRLRRPLGPDVILTPDGGWGFIAERKIGNALSGQEVLSGAGARVHVLSLAPYAGDVARIVFQAAGDVSGGSGSWSLAGAGVDEAPTLEFDLDAEGPRIFAETESSAESGVTLSLFQGREAVTPLTLVGEAVWDGAPRQELGKARIAENRFEIVWRDAAGRWGSATRILGVGPSLRSRILGNPYPNPLASGSSQRWPVLLAEGVPPGFYRIHLYDVAGRLQVERRVRVETSGTREVLWNGRDDTGRPAPGGVYFLQVIRPDGKTDARKIVVLP